MGARKGKALLLVMAASLGATACSAQLDDAADESSDQSAAVRLGNTSAHFPAAGTFTRSDDIRAMHCRGTLIAADVVLTSAACAYGLRREVHEGRARDFRDISFLAGTVATGAHAPISNVVVHPSHELYRDDPKYDVAYVLLDRALKGIEPAHFASMPNDIDRCDFAVIGYDVYDKTGERRAVSACLAQNPHGALHGGSSDGFLDPSDIGAALRKKNSLEAYGLVTHVVQDNRFVLGHVGFPDERFVEEARTKSRYVK
jgi:hypothetical protein